MERTVFVISDLHVGGAPPTQGRPRGFRICTQIDALASFVAKLPELAPSSEIELVINGDFVDFLAEEHEGGFVPFIEDESTAATIFQRIVDQNRVFFAALATHLANGHQLTILSGNHDVELTYPAVRRKLHEALGRPARGLRLQLDGRPLRFQNAVIEHGHQYDGWNGIAPRTLADLIVRGDGNLAPPGSHLVAEVMNPLKRSFAFIDLLKPEEETVVPVILALDRSVLLRVGRIVALWHEASRRQGKIDADEFIDLAATDDVAENDAIEAVRAIVDAKLGDNAESFWTALTDYEPESTPIEAAARTLEEGAALLSLLVANPVQQSMLYQALRVVQRDLSFERSREHDPRYRKAAESYATGIEYVVMGHTHLAKEHRNVIPGRTYLNCGTWADLIPFPQVFDPDDGQGRRDCEAFVRDLERARTDPSVLNDWIAFRPTYVQLECDGDRVLSARLDMFTAAREPKRRYG